MRILIAVLCVAGLYVAGYMYRKQRLIERGELLEDSIVSTPRAKALAGVSNALFGFLYFAGVLAALPWLQLRFVSLVVLAASLLAFGFSVYLAYSLLFVTKRPCAYCWTGHSINL